MAPADSSCAPARKCGTLVYLLKGDFMKLTLVTSTPKDLQKVEKQIRQQARKRLKQAAKKS